MSTGAGGAPARANKANGLKIDVPRIGESAPEFKFVEGQPAKQPSPSSLGGGTAGRSPTSLCGGNPSPSSLGGGMLISPSSLGGGKLISPSSLGGGRVSPASFHGG
jgi:hypothetical protein